MFAETRKVKRTMRRLLAILLFLLLIAGVLMYFIISDIMTVNDNKGVFVYNAIPRVCRYE